MIEKIPFITGLNHIDKTMTAWAGGKAANLGELFHIGEIHVPDGFCVTTRAYRKATADIPGFNSLLNELSKLKAEDREKISAISRQIRMAIEGVPVDPKISDEIGAYLSNPGNTEAYAVRSSATAEDLPGASFAGQQDTYLNCIGIDSILMHITRCWASLFTERAIIYRIQNGFDHRKVYLAVIVQRMVMPDVSGILFTADPVTGNRKVISIDAGFGLGEAMVSGLVNADNYKVQSYSIVDKKIAAKERGIYAINEGGTIERYIEPDIQNRQALTDAQILQLGLLGRQIEAHFACPQDIEWCLANDRFYILQSRPITTLFPIPSVNDGQNHVFVSVGHQQMMTDAMKPLGLALFQRTAFRPMFAAGGRLFVDITQQLATVASRAMVINMLGQSDPLIKDALLTITGREDFIPINDEATAKTSTAIPSAAHPPIENNPVLVEYLIQRSEASVAALKKDIQTRSGAALIDFIINDIPSLKTIAFDPQSSAVIMTAQNTAAWLNEKMLEWLGEKNAADILTQSVPNNITSEMGLALMDVADAIRPYSELINYLQQTPDNHFPDGLLAYEGGKQAFEAVRAFLNRYGMRCAGEIDITRTRWSENPAGLIPVILTNIKNFEPGAGKRKFDQGLQGALIKEQEILDQLKQQPDGEQKARETEQKIGLLRQCMGYREYPKYGIVSRYLVYKQALLSEAEKLVKAGLLNEKEDIYYLNFEEIRELIHSQTLDKQIISERKEVFRHFEKLTPPRVLTSEGEKVTGAYQRSDIPKGALPGLAVSSGVVEGRARVLLNMEEADMETGDILVTTFTDPGWTTLFVSIKGLVTEVGGLMTHGAVIAREYGLPAVVAVAHATTLIKDGQMIRVNGTEGWVEVLNMS